MTDNEKACTLSVQLRRSTAILHKESERTGVIASIIRGTASLSEYLLLIRNLLPVYRTLEDGLDRHRLNPAIAPFAQRELYRADMIESDLVGLVGPQWPCSLPLLSSAEDYVAAVALASQSRGEALLGHAYVRYLGDLSGGQTMHQILSKNLPIRAEHLSFFEFPLISDLSVYRDGFRQALDRAQALVDQTCVIEAAVSAFRFNLALSMAIGQPVSAPSRAQRA